MADFNDKVNAFLNTPTSEETYTQKDKEDNKVMSILAYLSVLVLIPIFACKESPYARFHSNQGLVLFLAEVIVSVCCGILDGIPGIGFLFGLVGYLADLAFLALSVVGIVNVARGDAKQLPVIGSFKVLK